ncbi:MAG: hypothetical protein Q7J07_08425 [Pelolinea sp.]|nr:hypothetical protein [Pelolinea sp.]
MVADVHPSGVQAIPLPVLMAAGCCLSPSIPPYAALRAGASLWTRLRSLLEK